MRTEIERKFLIRRMPPLEGKEKVAIKQGYVIITRDGTEARVRQMGAEKYLTIKSAGSLSRSEVEIQLNDEQFETLWKATGDKQVVKDRYIIQETESTMILLDVFSRDLVGLVVIEVEFASESASYSFVPPDWFGEEITFNNAYKNKTLAMNGIPSPR